MRLINRVLTSSVSTKYLKGFGLLGYVFALISGGSAALGGPIGSDLEAAVLVIVATEFFLAGLVLDRLQYLSRRRRF